MSVELREVTRENLQEVLKLRVAPGQEQFVASNAVSLAQAHFHPDVAWFRAIYAGGIPVGFAMLEDDAAAQRYFLWRFMIDARFQRQGHGRAAIELLVEHVRTRPGAKELLTSCVDAPGGPGPFYRRMGFEYTGEMEGGERVMRRAL